MIIKLKIGFYVTKGLKVQVVDAGDLQKSFQRYSFTEVISWKIRLEKKNILRRTHSILSIDKLWTYPQD